MAFAFYPLSLLRITPVLFGYIPRTKTVLSPMQSAVNLSIRELRAVTNDLSPDATPKGIADGRSTYKANSKAHFWSKTACRMQTL